MVDSRPGPGPAYSRFAPTLAGDLEPLGTSTSMFSLLRKVNVLREMFPIGERARSLDETAKRALTEAVFERRGERAVAPGAVTVSVLSVAEIRPA
jgi:hypothetical protein